MIDLKKRRYLVKDRLTGRVDKYGHEEKPCDYCYMKNRCAMNPSDCWELDMYLKLKSFELAIESGELVQVVHGRWNRERKIDKLYSIQCSSCGTEWLFEPYKTVENMNHNFCPNCGAKMDLEGEK